MMKIKNFTLLCFFSIAFSQISVNELRKFSNSELDKIRQQLEVETEDRKDLEIVDTELSSEMSEISIVKNSYSNEESEYFGYNYFNQEISFFDNIPTPADFKIGPGDELILSLWGENNIRQKFTVNKNGMIYFENIGFINLSNKSLQDAEFLLKAELSKIYATLNDKENPTNLQLELGKIKSINVYFTGQVTNPGISLIHPFSDIFTALIQSGGINEKGTLRQVQLIRNGEIIEIVDFYSFFGSGIAEFQKIKLIDGDIINVPIFQKRVQISGSVNNPMTYELLDSETLQSLINFAGGLTSTASQKALIESIVPLKQRNSDDSALFSSIININKSSEVQLEDGASIDILSIADNSINVTVFGRVTRPGKYPALSSLKSEKNVPSSLKDVLDAAGGFDDPVFRKTIDEKIVVLRQDDQKFYASEFTIDYNNSSSFKLEVNDKIFVYENINYRNSFTYRIEGEINKPGTYPLKQGITLEEAIKVAGGLTQLASYDNVVVKQEFTNLDEEGNETTITENVGNVTIDFILGQNSVINVLPFENVVNVEGNVYNPGLVAYQKGMTMSQAIVQAGGYKPYSLKKSSYVKKSNGQIDKANIFRGRTKRLLPGDTIVVPLNPDPTDFDITTFIADLSTTLANIAAILLIVDNQND